MSAVDLPPADTPWCETTAVSEPPPPAAAEPGTSWDTDRAREIAEFWYHPLVEPATWLAVAYLFVGMLAGIGFFVAMVSIGATVFGLSFAGVGVLLFGVFFRMVGAFAAAERAMAAWVGAPIEPRQMAPIRGLGIRSVADPERWRQVGYFAINLFVAPVLFTLGFTAVGLLFDLDAVPWPIAVAVGAFLLGAAPRIARFFARIKHQIAAWFLGPDRLAVAEERVTSLSIQRQEILDAVAAERRRIERNLHDGVQQQLVAIGLDLGMAHHQLDDDPIRARELIALARDKVQGSIGELRSLGRGLHPAILDGHGIDAALSAVAAGASIPISVHVDPDLDLPTDVQATVYFIVNEAIANVLKHARARGASINVARVGANVRVMVHDDGHGGAAPIGGTGLAGIRARVHGVDGAFTLTSPAGGPTTLVAEIPRHGAHAD